MKNPKALIDMLNNLEVDFEEVIPPGSVKRKTTTFNGWIDYIFNEVKKTR
jgi:hypothetical protein